MAGSGEVLAFCLSRSDMRCAVREGHSQHPSSKDRSESASAVSLGIFLSTLVVPNPEIHLKSGTYGRARILVRDATSVFDSADALEVTYITSFVTRDTPSPTKKVAFAKCGIRNQRYQPQRSPGPRFQLHVRTHTGS